MKTSRCVSIQIFPFQLLLFWWAYCSLFPWHPAAILQLLIFTSMEEKKKKRQRSPLVSSPFFLAQKIWRQTQRLRQRNSRYVSHLRSKIAFASANEQLQDYSVLFQNKNLEVLCVLCRPFLFTWAENESVSHRSVVPHWLIRGSKHY